MGTAASNFSLDKLKETARVSSFSGPLVERDKTAVFLDWDDTLFPSTWVQNMQRRCRAAGQPVHLRGMPEMRALCTEITSFLSAASRIGHIFIVTAASQDFVRKCCRVSFPEVFKKLEDLQVTIVYARPCGDFEWTEDVEQWKEAAFLKILQAPHERPLVPRLSRFYEAAGWENLVSYGDQWTDHTALASAAAAVSPASTLKTLKAHRNQNGLTPGALAEELRWVGSMLPSLARLETGCSYDLDDPDVRHDLDLPTPGDLPSEASPRRSPGSRGSLSSLYRMMDVTPTHRSASSSSFSSFLSTGTNEKKSFLDEDTETNPDYMHDVTVRVVPLNSKQHWVLCDD